MLGTGNRRIKQMLVLQKRLFLLGWTMMGVSTVSFLR